MGIFRAIRREMSAFFWFVYGIRRATKRDWLDFLEMMGCLLAVNIAYWVIMPGARELDTLIMSIF